jgi:uncharacterized protein (DUF305 family)
MKRLLLMGMAITTILASCNNNKSAEQEQQGDTTMATHAGPHANAPATGTTGTVSMMDMMHANMQQMMAIPSSQNTDKDFASMMRIHHQGAVEMAQAEIAQGSDSTLKSMAQKMITDQQEEIKHFDEAIAKASDGGGNDAFHKAAMADMHKTEMKMTMQGSIDQQFTEMMIHHHQGGIDMARAYLKNGAKDSELKKIASSIITSQQKEIAAMQSWLKSNAK